jgi:hypothetical protein
MVSSSILNQNEAYQLALQHAKKSTTRLGITQANPIPLKIAYSKWHSQSHNGAKSDPLAPHYSYTCSINQPQ